MPKKNEATANEAARSQAVTRPWDVWEFRSVDGKQVVQKVFASYPGSTKYQSEYQRLIGQVIAFNATEALSLALSQASNLRS